MPSLIILSCPVCGGPVQLNSSRCDYCGSVVVILTSHPRIDPQSLNKAVVEEHIAKFRVTLRRDPNDETAHYGLGVAYFNLGLLDDAARELSEAARLMPENPHIQSQLAIVFGDLARDGHPEAEAQAWDRIRRTLVLRPNYPEALILTAKLRLRRGEYQAAVKEWLRIAKDDPSAVQVPVERFLRAYPEITALAIQSLETVEERSEARTTLTTSERNAILWGLPFLLLLIIGLVVRSERPAYELMSSISTFFIYLGVLGVIVLPTSIVLLDRSAKRKDTASIASDLSQNLAPEGRTIGPERALEIAELVSWELEEQSRLRQEKMARIAAASRAQDHPSHSQRQSGCLSCILVAALVLAVPLIYLRI